MRGLTYTSEYSILIWILKNPLNNSFSYDPIWKLIIKKPPHKHQIVKEGKYYSKTEICMYIIKNYKTEINQEKFKSIY